MSDLSSHLDGYIVDAVRALPAALARVLLGWKAEPGARMFLSLAEKGVILLGSIALAVMCGDLARLYPATAPYCAMIVIAVAFNAQHVSTRLVSISNPVLRYLDKETRNRLKKRTSHHDH